VEILRQWRSRKSAPEHVAMGGSGHGLNNKRYELDKKSGVEFFGFEFSFFSFSFSQKYL
jgi:hypothetical protein